MKTFGMLSCRLLRVFFCNLIFQDGKNCSRVRNVGLRKLITKILDYKT